MCFACVLFFYPKPDLLLHQAALYGGFSIALFHCFSITHQLHIFLSFSFLSSFSFSLPSYLPHTLLYLCMMPIISLSISLNFLFIHTLGQTAPRFGSDLFFSCGCMCFLCEVSLSIAMVMVVLSGTGCLFAHPH